jgi:hypothetical protein
VGFLLGSVLNLSHKQSTIAVNVLLSAVAILTWLAVLSVDSFSRMSLRKKVAMATAAAAVIVLALSWSIYFFKLAPAPIGYPWVSTRSQIVDANSVQGAVLQVLVRDYPRSTEEEKGVLSLLSLHNLHVVISTPVAITPDGGWPSCTLSDFHVPEWNNDNGNHKPLGILDLKDDTTVLEIQASATNAQWSGAIVIKRNGKQLDWEESLGGWTVSESGESSPMLVTEVRKNGQTTNASGNGERITADLLKRYGVPVQTGTAVPQCCPALRRFGN